MRNGIKDVYTKERLGATELHGDINSSSSPQGRAQDFLLVQDRRAEGQQWGWGSRGGQQPHFPPAKRSGERCELTQRGSGRSPDRPKGSHYFRHSGWPLLTLAYNIVHCGLSCSHSGDQTPSPPLAYAPASPSVPENILPITAVS